MMMIMMIQVFHTVIIKRLEAVNEVLLEGLILFSKLFILCRYSFLLNAVSLYLERRNNTMVILQMIPATKNTLVEGKHCVVRGNMINVQ
jgi:hypothetical protein